MRHPRVETQAEANRERNRIAEWLDDRNQDSAKKWGSIIAVATGAMVILGTLAEGAISYSGKADKTQVQLIKDSTVTKTDFTEFKTENNKRFDTIDGKLDSIRTTQEDTRNHQTAFENFLKGQMSRNK